MDQDHAAISGDFSRIFDATDYMAMVNGTDEAACVLRGHLVLEEFLNSTLSHSQYFCFTG